MPWTETRIMDERVKFISEVLEGNYSMTDLCNAYSISLKTGYKWLDRYSVEGPAGLCDCSRAPVNHANAVSDEVVDAIVSIKKRFCKLGPAKIRIRLQTEHTLTGTAIRQFRL